MMVAHTDIAQSVRDSYVVCEDIARRNKPHLYAAAQYFEHEETRRAFAATYASMRLIDDFIDDIPERANLTDGARQEATRHVKRWLDQVRAAHAGQSSDGVVWAALADTFTRFPIPVNPWTDLARAMETDLFVPMFRDWDHLRRYMRGASVAPAIVFMYLVLMHPRTDGDGFECAWEYDRVVAATEDLAVFCYWVHILRDVATDLSLGKTGLVYIPQADLERHGLTVADLHDMRAAGRATDHYKNLARFEAERARGHLERGSAYLEELLSVSIPSHGQALTRLVNTYAFLLENLTRHEYDVFSQSLELTPSQLSEIHES